jgi:hypothetical protein
MKWMEEWAVYDSESGAEVRFFGLFEPPDLTGAEETETLIVVEDVNARADTIAYEYWGDPNLDWFLCYYNDLDVPEAYLHRGMQLRVPSKEWVSSNILLRTRESAKSKV